MNIITFASKKFNNKPFTNAKPGQKCTAKRCQDLVITVEFQS